MSQLCLPIVGVTRCGYCNRRLELQPAGDWKCGRCAPLLAQLPGGPYDRMVAAFAAFQRQAAKDRA